MSTANVVRFSIPAGTAKGFRVEQGRHLRVIEEEGGQVATLIVLNAHNYKEQGTSRYSGNLSQFLGTGNHYRVGTIFSQVPWQRPMLRVTRDTVGRHFQGPHCTGRMMDVWGVPGHRSCTDALAEAMAEFGLTLEDIFTPDAVNLFANVTIDPLGDGTVTLSPPVAQKGDLVEFVAEMDVLVLVSACPDDVSPLNGGRCVSIGIEIE